MSTKSVYSTRIPVELRKVMDEMEEVNWPNEIRHVVEELVRGKNKKRLLTDAKNMRKDMKVEVNASELIRDDRDVR